MHMNYEAQLATKKNLVVEAFNRYFNGTLNEYKQNGVLNIEEILKKYTIKD